MGEYLKSILCLNDLLVATLFDSDPTSQGIIESWLELTFIRLRWGNTYLVEWGLKVLPFSVAKKNNVVIYCH